MKKVFAFIFWGIAFHSLAQDSDAKTIPDSISTVVFTKQPVESFMLWQIKSIHEFIHRFNYETFIDGTKMNDSLQMVYPRSQYILKLFNEDDERLKITEKTQPYFIKVNQFIAMICEEDIKIEKQAKLSAMVKVEAYYQENEVTFDVYLQKQYQKKEASARWQITNISLPKEIIEEHQHLIERKDITTIDSTYREEGLNPNAQDIAFSPLINAFNQEKSIVSLCNQTILKHQEIYILEKILRLSLLKVKGTKDIIFKINVHKNYQIEIREFMREKENSGWLITDLKQN
ncbi:hypothetical protein VB776_15810 [Arcicella sp. DC2W]|uniref:Conjugative transposon protein TcpC n=1 Tax=Arcicella gelida TaxID=2984195 RepID=A0ABU5S7E3_9BACT|nr:hypothetical protein [Arcicella sp. DC2W]MEA5404399.1 hypothetical protein [Arcicella sp. DC2W]